MKRSVKSVLVPAVLLVGLVLAFPHAAWAGHGSVYVSGHFAGPHTAYVYGHHHPYTCYRNPYGYYEPHHVYYGYYGYYGIPPVVQVYRPPVAVAAPTVGVYYGPVHGPRAVVYYHVW